MTRVLFLCTGNYFRSRFAQEWFNAQAERRGLSDRLQAVSYTHLTLPTISSV